MRTPSPCVSFIYAFPRGETPIYRNFFFYFIDQMRKQDDDDDRDDDSDDDECGLWANA